MALDAEKGLDIAAVYAGALFDLAAAAGTLDEVRGELEELVGLQESDPRFAAFMTSDAVDDDDRERSLDKMFRGRLSDTVLNTLQVMNHHGRSALLAALLRAFVLRLEEHRGQIEATVTSAVELGDEQKAEVERLAGELSGRNPLVAYVVDADVIGGLVLSVGGQRYDNSVRQHLRAARVLLLERSNKTQNE